MLANGMKISVGIASRKNIALARTLAMSGLIAALVACGESTAVGPDAVSAPQAVPVQQPASDIVAQYNLQSIAGVALPISYTGGGATWDIIGGHYVLYANGTFDFYYDFSPSKSWGRVPTGTYVRSANGVIDFYLTIPYGTFYEERHGHFATGTVSGNVMRTTYDDPIDFDPEVYVAK